MNIGLPSFDHTLPFSFSAAKGLMVRECSAKPLFPFSGPGQGKWGLCRRSLDDPDANVIAAVALNTASSRCFLFPGFGHGDVHQSYDVAKPASSKDVESTYLSGTGTERTVH